MTAVEPAALPTLRPWLDGDLVYMRGYVVDRRTGEVLSSLLADHLRELKGLR